MKIEVIRKNNIDIAIVNSDETLITDVSSALDLIMTILYETNCTNIAINKEELEEKFLLTPLYFSFNCQ